MTRTKSVKALLCVLLSMTLIIAFMPQTANVYAASAKKVTKITKVTSKASKYTMTAGTSKTFQVKLYPKNLTKSARTTYVSTSKKSVAATYSKKYKKTKYGYTYVSFKVKAVKAGTATVTAKAKSGKKVTWNITVKAAPVAVKTVAISNYSTGVDTAIATGNILKATVAPAGATVSYQWYTVDAAGTATAIAGATEQTYKVAGSAAAKQLKVVVKGTGNYTGTAEATTTAKVQFTALSGVALTDLNGTAMTPVVGTAVKATTTPADVEATYQWYIADTTTAPYYAISGATNATYIPVATDLGKSLKVIVTGTGAYAGVNPVHAEATVTTDLAKVAGLTVTNTDTTTTAKVILTADLTKTPLASGVKYAWYLDSISTTNQLYSSKVVATGQESDSTFSLDKELYTKDAKDVFTAVSLAGHKLVCVANGTGTYGGTLNATSTTVVGKVSGETYSVTTPANIKVGTKIIATPTISNVKVLKATDATVTYQWYRNTTAIDGATAAEYTATSADLTKTLTCKISGTGNFSGSADVQMAGPVLASTGISATVADATVGKALTATLTPAVAASDVTYQWYTGASTTDTTKVIAGATSASYTPATSGQYSVKITVNAAAAAAYAVDEVSVTANAGLAITSIALAEDVNTAGLWKTTLNPTTADVTYAWYVDNTAAANQLYTVGGSSGSWTKTVAAAKDLATNAGVVLDKDFVATAIDKPSTSLVGHKLICVAKGQNSYVGAEVKATSATITGKVATPIISDTTPEVGEEIQVTDATLTGTLGTDCTLQWYADGFAISGATAQKYTVTKAEYGKVITVKATGIGNYAGSTAGSDAATAVAAKTVTAGPSATTASVNTAVSVVFTPAEASSFFTYQWYQGVADNGTILTGETTATHTLTAADRAAGGVYCVVTDAATSQAYKLGTSPAKVSWLAASIAD